MNEKIEEKLLVLVISVDLFTSTNAKPYWLIITFLMFHFHSISRVSYVERLLACLLAMELTLVLNNLLGA